MKAVEFSFVSDHQVMAVRAHVGRGGGSANRQGLLPKGNKAESNLGSPQGKLNS